MRKFFASILVVFFIASSVTLTLVGGFFNVFFDKDLYTNDQFINASYDFSIDKILDLSNLEDLSVLKEDELKEILISNLKKEDLLSLVNNVFDQFSDIKVDQNDNAAIVISLDWFKEHLTEISEQISKKLYKDLEECETDKDLELQFVSDITCIPLNITEEEFELQTRTYLENDVFVNIPPEITIFFTVPDKFNGNLLSFIDNYFSNLNYVFIIIAFTILISIGFLIYSPPLMVVKWEVFTLMLSSGIISAGLLLFQKLPDLLVNLLESNDKVIESKNQITYMIYILNFTIEHFVNKFIIYSLLIFIISLFIYITTIIKLRKKNKILTNHDSQ